MPLPPATPRTVTHTRSLRIEVFRRDDGAWDVEGELEDVSPFDSPLPSGVCPGGEALHRMRLRLTIDESFAILDAHAVSERVPYGDECKGATEAYRGLVGLNLFHGFAAALRERVGRTAGCTHLTELARFMPSAAVQAVAGEKLRRREMFQTGDGESRRPFTLDGCRAWRSDGPVVERHLPMWYRPRAGAANDSSVSSKEPK